MDAAPFRALRYDAAVAGDPASTSAPSYDDLSRFQYARHRTVSPYTVLELLAPGDRGGYENAGAAYRRWLRTGVLVEEATPAYFLYEIHELRHGVPAVLRGVLAAVDVTAGTLLPHERVHGERVRSRLARLASVPADLAPVFAVHTPAGEQFRAVVDAAPSAPPVVAFTDDDGADHRIWALRNSAATATLTRELAQVTAVIADGHHRFGAAVALHQQGGDGRTLTYLVDAEAYGPQLLAVHRVVDPAPVDLLARLAPLFEAHPVAQENLAAALVEHSAPAFGLRSPYDQPLLLVARDPAAVERQLPPDHSSAWRSLDAAVFDHVVRPLLGDVPLQYLPDPDSPNWPATPDTAAVFMLRPPPLETVYACAMAGEALPAKSTWFRPKPRAGLIMRSLESAR